MASSAAGDVIQCDRWMTELHRRYGLGSLALTEMHLLGSHDSGTYEVTPQSGPAHDADNIIARLLSSRCLGRITGAITAPWARTQTLTVRQQLELGVRYIDLRLAVKNGLTPNTFRGVGRQALRSSGSVPHHPGETIWTCHTVWGSPLRQIVNDIESFFAALPADHYETLVVDVQGVKGSVELDGRSLSLWDMQHHQLLLDEMAPLLPRVIPTSCDLSRPIADIWATERGRVVLLHQFRDPETAEEEALEDEERTQRGILPRKLIHAHFRPRSRHLCDVFPAQPSLPLVLQSLETDIDKRMQSATKSEFFVTQCVMTPRAKNIIGGILGCGTCSLLHFAQAANAKLLQWYCDRVVQAKARSHRFNILLLDFVGTHSSTDSPIQALIELNIRLLKGMDPEREPF